MKLMFAALLIALSCTGPAGPAGPVGPQGSPGPASNYSATADTQQSGAFWFDGTYGMQYDFADSRFVSYSSNFDIAINTSPYSLSCKNYNGGIQKAKGNIAPLAGYFGSLNITTFPDSFWVITYDNLHYCKLIYLEKIGDTLRFEYTLNMGANDYEF